MLIYWVYKNSYEDKKDIAKTSNFLSQIYGILNHVLKPNLAQRQSKMKVHNILAIPSVLHGCEI
jgi:hypothetical protein